METVDSTELTKLQVQLFIEIYKKLETVDVAIAEYQKAITAIFGKGFLPE